jgi:hypothetical protein
MSKRQDKLHAGSLARIKAYESLNETIKKGHTRPSEVSCKRVNPTVNYTVEDCIRILGIKGARTDNNLVDLKGSYLGIKARGRVDFLRARGFVFIGN